MDINRTHNFISLLISIDWYRLSIDYAWSNQESPEFVIIISPTPLTPLDPTINMRVLQVTFH